MNFRPYDILTQLIPGVFVVGYVILVFEKRIIDSDITAGLYAFGTALSFIVGYIINGLGHFFAAIFSRNINNKVLDYYLDPKKCSWLKLFKPFTKLRYNIEEKKLDKKKFQEIFEKIKPNQHDRIKWLNQDKKFARSLIIMSLILILMNLFLDIENESIQEYSTIIKVVLYLLFLISVYRYIQTSIDYSFWVVKMYEKKQSKN